MSEYMDALLSEHTGFTVTDDMKAAWCVQKIAQAQREAAALLKHYDEQARKVKEQLDSTEQYFKGLLFPYFQTVPHKPGKTQQSYALPGATLVLKQQAPTFTRDSATLIEYLKKAAPEFVKVATVTTETAEWGEYKKRTTVNGGAVIDTETGEVVQA
jgi:hypothetical protein